MALKHLESEQMVELTAPLVRNKGALLRAVPEAAGLFVHVEAAHEGVIAARPAASSKAPDDAARMREQAETDARHDDALRAVWYGLTGGAAYQRARGGAEGHAEAEQTEALRDRLLPNGLAATQQSYLAEAGAARQVSAMLDDELREKLAAFGLSNGATVADAVAIWCNTGARLGELEREKSDAAARYSPGRIQEARNQWISVVTTLLAVVELSHAPLEAREAVRRHILEASERAAQRYATPEKPEPVEPTPPTPAPTPQG